MKANKLLALSSVLGIPIAFALIFRAIFVADIVQELYELMSWSFFIGLPYGVGALTIGLSPVEWVRSLAYRIFAPWVPILLFLVITLALSIEGWGCWLMVLPIFLVCASLGGLTAGYFKLRKSDRANKLNLSLSLLAPLLISPVEQSLQSLPVPYEAYTSAIIQAPGEKIWANVVRVRAIRREEDSGWLTGVLGFPRPIQAELNYAGVGGSRKAIFSGGLVFDEVVLAYAPQRKMRFSIKANPHDIPSTTMDEHIVVGGTYFDVLDGTYELEKLGENRYKLHLYSHFQLNTHVNFYATYWARWIMQDIQNNILAVVRARSEQQEDVGQ